MVRWMYDPELLARECVLFVDIYTLILKHELSYRARGEIPKRKRPYDDIDTTFQELEAAIKKPRTGTPSKPQKTAEKHAAPFEQPALGGIDEEGEDEDAEEGGDTEVDTEEDEDAE